MDISLIHTGLAAGAGLAAVPVILHLFMRQTPKHVIFPALRLIRERQKRSKKRLRVKNWLLLLARMALLALMALALARPRITSEGSQGDNDVPTAIGLVFDTSMSMEYKERDKTRLDEAKARAEEILARTPSSSQVYVVDSADPAVPAALSPAAARKRIDGLTIRAVNRPLNAALGLAYAAVAESDRQRHDVYVLTDLARSAWDMDRPAEGLDKAKKDKTGVKTYVLRLTPKEVHDVGIIDARPTLDQVTEGESVEIKARIRAVGPAASGVVKLWLDDVPKENKTVDIPANGEREVSFVIKNVDATTSLHQGKVQFIGKPDPLAFDDVRYFTFSLKPPTHVLVVSDQAVDAEFIAAAIDPEPLHGSSSRPFRVEKIRTFQLQDQAENLSKRYRVVFLNNVEQLGEEEWVKLRGFVLDGGGLVVGLGNRSLSGNYSTITPAQLLPAAVEEQKPIKDGTTFGEILDLTHPLFAQFQKELSPMLHQAPVSKYWGVSVREGSRTLLTYADKAPALVERIFPGPRTGRVLLWTTPLSRRSDSTSPDAWNEFPNDLICGWSFFILMNQTVNYLSGATVQTMNYEAGKDVIVPIDPARRFKNYIVQGPEHKASERLTPTANSDSLAIVAQQPGQWTVVASGDDGKSETRGFSINAPAEETRFAVLENPDLEKLFGGKDGFSLADDAESLKRAVEKIRIGRELFPWVMLLIMVVVTVESVLANRFYRESAQQRPALSPA